MDRMHLTDPGKEKLFTQAFREIRAYILRNGLKPGDLLPTEQALSETLNVSRNVLREGIKGLELMGMVEACRGRGTAVKEFNLDFIFQNLIFFNVGNDEEKVIREMLILRRTLELSFLAQAFISITDEDIARLKACLAQMRDRWSRQELFGDVDQDFHLTLFRGLDNSVLNSVLRAVWAADDTFELEKKRSHLPYSIEKHAAIVTALEEKDYDLFNRAMQAHFASGKYMSEGNYEEY